MAMQAPVAEPAVLFVQLAMHAFCSPLHAIGAACIVSARNRTNPTMTAIAQIALYDIAAPVLSDRSRNPPAGHTIIEISTLVPRPTSLEFELFRLPPVNHRPPRGRSGSASKRLITNGRGGLSIDSSNRANARHFKRRLIQQR
ncbi:MAG: hypothetical protein HYX37_03835 [Rhizobiales bacterium]|nr:hypothetical protein [Hyphomicrobiales bacterium]